MERLTRICSIFLACAVLWAASAAGQTAKAPDGNPDKPAQDGTWRRLRGNYEAKPAALVSFENSGRVSSLMRDGKLFLSLDDAIALALENNLDIELQRFEPAIASSDLMRARGGGLLRGVPLAVNELPPGVGGPAGPILNLPATGAPFSSAVSTNLSELTSILPGQSNASIGGPSPLSNGTPVPGFEPVLSGLVNSQHFTAIQVNPSSSGTKTLFGRATVGNFGFQKAFSPGTLFSANFNANLQNSNSRTNLYNPYINSYFSISVSQPLLRGFGPQVNRRFIRIAANNQKVGDLVFRQQVISSVAGVIRLYFDLVSLQEDVLVKRQTLELVQRLHDDNKAKVEQGTLAPIELVRARAQMASSRQDLANSEGFESQQELLLKNVLTRKGTADPILREARIVPTTPIEIPASEDIPAIQDLVGTAYRNRPELEEGRLQVENAEVSLKGSQSALRPDLSLVALAQNNGFAGQANPLAIPGSAFLDPAFIGGFGASLEQIFRRNYPMYGVGIQLNLPLRNQVAQADYARDSIQLRQTQVRYQQLENQIRLEVESALVALRRSRAAYDAALEARKLQEQSLQIEMEKYAGGVSTNFLVMQYQSFLAQARSTEVSARGVYAKAKTALERALGKTLENHSISVDEAFTGRVTRPPASLPPTQQK